MSDDQIREYLIACGYRESDPDFHRLLGLLKSFKKQLEQNDAN